MGSQIPRFPMDTQMKAGVQPAVMAGGARHKQNPKGLKKFEATPATAQTDVVVALGDGVQMVTRSQAQHPSTGWDSQTPKVSKTISKQQAVPPGQRDSRG